MKRERFLKIYSKYRSHKSGQNLTIPEIRLQGLWLKKNGFEIGKNISIRIKKEKLIITIVNKENFS